MTTDKEALGPAEHIIKTILTHTDHAYHGRPGLVVADARTKIGVRWDPVTHKEEGDEKVVYRLTKSGNKSIKTRVGVLREDNKVMNGASVVGEYREPGLFPEVVNWLYSQISEVWKLDNEFAARWASYAFKQDHRDLKVIIAAFMLVQSRKGEPVMDEGKFAFCDDDFRGVGEAMMLITEKGIDLNPKLLLRIHGVLGLPEVAAINRELGFGQSARNPFYGRWSKAVEKWLRYRENNPKMLDGLVKAGFRTTVMELTRRVGYKPITAKFFWTLRWKQIQAKDGRRTVAIGEEVKEVESWKGFSEKKICKTITSKKPNWKRIVGLLPRKVGVTRAIVAAAMEAGCLSNKDIVILTPTIEDLGLMKVQEVRERWEQAVKASEDMRAANIARNVKSQVVKDVLQEGADEAAKKEIKKAMKGVDVYVIIDVSASMQGAIEEAKGYISMFLQGFPPEQLHVSIFNTAGRKIRIEHNTEAGVKNAFKGVRAGGGTDYGAGVRVLADEKPAEGNDAVFIFIGDEEGHVFTNAVRNSGLNPVAFGFVKVTGSMGGWYDFKAVTATAAELDIPCFKIDNSTFSDTYAIPRTVRNLIESTPVGRTTASVAPKRVSLIDQVLATDLLQKPTWA